MGEGRPGCRQRYMCVLLDWVCLFCLWAVLLSGHEGEKGRADVRADSEGQRSRGQTGHEGRRLALRLFAALSFPLAALAHLHLRQLDVPQHVGV